MRAAAGAISRVQARARAHQGLFGQPELFDPFIGPLGLDLGSIHCGQLWVTSLLTHV